MKTLVKRDYQERRINEVLDNIEDVKTIVSQLPTGGGKTVEFSQIALRYYFKHKRSVVIAVHRIELLNQAVKTITASGITPKVVTSKTRTFQYGCIYVCMVKSLTNRLHLIEDAGLVIIDECHVADFKQLHEIFDKAVIVGFTATPISATKKDPLKNYYSKIVVGPQINQLIADGHLAQNITRCPKEVIDYTQFEIDNRKGDFNERQMSDEYSKPRCVINTVYNYRKYCRPEKTIVFNVTKEHSKAVNDAFLDCGYNSRHLDSDASEEERAEILKWFAENDDAILNNVMIATVGFDEPTIRNVILNFSTLSLVKFLQCCGRGGRRLPDKDSFNIIDMGGNCIRFGDWNDDRDWESLFYDPPIPGNGVAPVKTCPNCECLVYASTMVCNNLTANGEVCGYEWERKEKALEKIMEEMVVITRHIDIPKLISKNKAKHDYYTFLDMGIEVVRSLYAAFPEPSEGYIIKAFDKYYNMCIQWYRDTLAGKDGNILDISDSQWHITRAKNHFNNLIKKMKP